MSSEQVLLTTVTGSEPTEKEFDSAIRICVHRVMHLIGPHIEMVPIDSLAAVLATCIKTKSQDPKQNHNS